MHMHFSHMNIFLGWEIEMTLKILKIKCRNFNPSEFLSHSFFLDGYFLLISFFIWKHITLLDNKKFYLKNSTIFHTLTIMHMHFSHMNIFLGWEIEMTLKILKIKYRNFNPSEFLSHSFFLDGYFLLISLFIWKRITLLDNRKFI